MKHVNHFVLDYSKWKSGSVFETKEGRSTWTGPTLLINSMGFMCCLGQFGSQCGIPYSVLVNRSGPEDILVPEFNQKMWQLGPSGIKVMMGVNDDPKTPTQERIIKIAETLLGHGITMTVKNLPKDFWK